MGCSHSTPSLPEKESGIRSTEILAGLKGKAKESNRALIINFMQKNSCKLTDTSDEFKKLIRENRDELL